MTCVSIMSMKAAGCRQKLCYGICITCAAKDQQMNRTKPVITNPTAAAQQPATRVSKNKSRRRLRTTELLAYRSAVPILFQFNAVHTSMSRQSPPCEIILGLHCKARGHYTKGPL